MPAAMVAVPIESGNASGGVVFYIARWGVWIPRPCEFPENWWPPQATGSGGPIRRQAAGRFEYVTASGRQQMEWETGYDFALPARCCRLRPFVKSGAAAIAVRVASERTRITAEEELIARPKPSDRVPHPPHHCRRVHAEKTEELFRPERAHDAQPWDDE